MTIKEYLISIERHKNKRFEDPHYLLYDSTRNILRQHVCNETLNCKPIKNPSIKLLIKLTRLGMITTVG